MSKSSCQKMERRARIIHRMDHFHVDVQRHLMGSQYNEQECELSAKLVSIYARRLSPGRWSFLGPGSEKMLCSTHDSKAQGEWLRVAGLMMIKFSESKHPVFRSKGGGKLSIHFCADEGTIETFFRTIISVDQLSVYGAVSDVCEVQIPPCKNRETCFGRTT